MIKFDGKEAEEISSLLYSVSNEQGTAHLFGADKCLELTEEIIKIINESVPAETVVTLRPSVQKFAEEMERKLKLNDHKGGWMGMTVNQILNELAEERIELGKAIVTGDKANILEECADNANYLMMLAEISASK